MDIRRDDLTGSAIRALLTEHLQSMRASSPPENVHALDLDALQRPDVAFWAIWDGPELLGCGACKRLDAEHGEIKSMRTATAHRGRGVAHAPLTHIVAEARRVGCTRLSLETGTQPEFAAARRLYERFGFDPTGPFGGHVLDPCSAFMSKDLTAFESSVAGSVSRAADRSGDNRPAAASQ